MASLKDTIAVVAGASRGGGRGIALALGEAGATVYVTGRTVRGTTPPDGAPGTIEDTAEAVTARGGIGLPVQVDHTVEAKVKALFERIRREQGHLDVLVNAVWGGNERYDGRTFGSTTRFDAPFWEHDLQRWREMIDAGVQAYFLTSYLAVPLMLPQRRGLIVHLTDGDGSAYYGNLFWDLAHAAINRMAYGMAQELERFGIAAVALMPGFMRTERVVASLEAHPDLVKQVGMPSESTEYVGRAIAALAADPDVLEKTGRFLQAGALAQEYGFTDVDGSQPKPFLPVTEA